MATRQRKKAPIRQTGRVLKEYRCLAHGEFEGYTEVCPHGCDTVERVFRTAFSIGGQSKNIDKTVDTLMADYGMTDVRNNGGETSVMEALRRGQTDYAPKWGSMPQVRAGEGGNAVGSMLAMQGAPSANVTGMLKDGGVLEAPRAIPLSPKHVDAPPISSVRGAE